VFAVADGMGGHAAGGEASAAAVLRLAAVAHGPTVEVDALRGALQEADHDIRQLGRGQSASAGAGTTVAGLALIESGGDLYWAAFHVGDSRIYRRSASGWERISRDHSVVQELVDDGAITAEQALTHPDRHMITRALGLGVTGEADFTLLPADGGQRFLLCSDGLTGVLSDGRLAEVMSTDAAAALIARQLVAEAVSVGAHDNVSAVVVDVQGSGRTEADGDDDPDGLEEITVPRRSGRSDQAGAGARA
jgi:protein phosphatase